MGKTKRDYRGSTERYGRLATSVGWLRRERFVALAEKEGVTLSEALARLVSWAIREGKLPPE